MDTPKGLLVPVIRQVQLKVMHCTALCLLPYIHPLSSSSIFDCLFLDQNFTSPPFTSHPSPSVRVVQSISQIAAELSDLQAKAFMGTLTERDMQGGTFTLVKPALCYAMLQYVIMLCCIVLSDATLCYNILYCTMLCYSAICYAVQHV
jgi:hypothetical protein